MRASTFSQCIICRRTAIVQQCREERKRERERLREARLERSMRPLPLQTLYSYFNRPPSSLLFLFLPSKDLTLRSASYNTLLLSVCPQSLSSVILHHIYLQVVRRCSEANIFIFYLHKLTNLPSMRRDKTRCPSNKQPATNPALRLPPLCPFSLGVPQ